MNSKELKKMIKPVVKQCLTEIFAEMQLETIVEGVVNDTLRNSGGSKHSLVEQKSVKVSTGPSREEAKRQMQERLHIDDNTWKDVYADIDADNPILTGEDADAPELISESALKESGLFKDYSKFVK